MLPSWPRSGQLKRSGRTLNRAEIASIVSQSGSSFNPASVVARFASVGIFTSSAWAAPASFVMTTTPQGRIVLETRRYRMRRLAASLYASSCGPKARTRTTRVISSISKTHRHSAVRLKRTLAARHSLSGPNFNGYCFGSASSFKNSVSSNGRNWLGVFACS